MMAKDQTHDRSHGIAAEIIYEIEKRSSDDKPLLVAIDGRSGTGKSTISAELGRRLGATVVNGDDFYSGGEHDEWLSKSPREKADWCIDWRRLRKEALEPLLAGREASWRTFDWENLAGLSDEVVTAKPARVVVLDGVYSGRPELADLVDLSVLVQLPDAVRREWLKNREGEEYVENWHKVWDEAEEYYFNEVCTPESYDLVVR